MFSATVRCGISENSWKTARTPWARASLTERNVPRWVPVSMVPALGSLAPAIIEMSVDFPAPFSPNSTCTRPGMKSRLTGDKARFVP